MALGKRLIIESSDIDGINTRIDVYLEGYTGPVATRNGGPDSPSITWGDQNSEQIPIVYGSECRFSFYAETDYEAADLFTTSPRDTFVEITKEDPEGDYIMWRGHIEPERYSEPLISPVYLVELTAFDGLGNLKEINFTQSDGSSYEGELTLLDVLSKILQKTGMQLPIRTNVEYRQQSLVSNNLASTSIYAPALAEMSCYDVIKLIYADCRVMQRGGIWYIFNNLSISDQYADASTSLNFREHNYLGNYSGGAVLKNLDATDWFIQDIAELKREAAFKKITFQQNFNKIENLLINPTFSNEGQNWTELGGVTTIYQGWNISEGVYLSGKEKPASPHEITKGISQSINLPAMSDELKFNLNFAIVGSFNEPAPVYVIISTYVSGTIYSVQKNSDGTYEFKSGYVALLVETQAANILAQASENTQSKTISVSGMPETGNVTIELLVPYTDKSDITGILWKNPALTIVSVSDDMPKNQTLTYLISNQNTKEISDIKTEGDIPNIDNNTFIYRGGFRDTSGAATTLWNINQDTGTFYEFAEMAIRMMGSHYRTARTKYQITLANLKLGMNIVITDPDNSDLKLIESGVTYNDRMKSYEGTYTEIVSIDMTAGTFSKVYDDEDSDSSSGGTSGGGSGGGTGGEPNVQSDWNETDPLSDSYIKNRDKVQTFTGADLTNRQITLTNFVKSECPMTVLYMNGKRITKTNYEEQATTSDILLTINVFTQPTDEFKLRIL